MKKIIFVAFLLMAAFIGCEKTKVEPSHDAFLKELEQKMESKSGWECEYKYYEPSEGLTWWDNVLYNPLVCPLCGDPVVILATKCGGIYIK
ncbi:MAG: hypothetical protein GYA14_15860 [Ignavibacteria bacterium]|nr:hypothetical protein [Ignavibacteria bacterium]